MANLLDLAPVKNKKIIDLVSAAGVDITDWANFKGGPSRAASNPKYCYEWAFIEPGKVVVINLWHKPLKESDGVIFQSLNMRERAQSSSNLSNEAVWARRAKIFDMAIQTAYREKLPLRVVICDGEMRNPKDPKSKTSRVKKRLLDPVPWAVTSYNTTTGDFIVTRGAKPSLFVDQFSAIDSEAILPRKRKSESDVYVRSAEVRATVLERSQGKCEWCQIPGFPTYDGRVFLETHHIIPLSEGGIDSEKNVVALCPNHHRKAHYGNNRDIMREKLLRKTEQLNLPNP